MEYYWFFALIIVLVLIKVVSVQRRQREELRQQIKDRWGKQPERTYTTEQLRAIRTYFDRLDKDGSEVDDITWNDLNMDEIYKLMNHTCSSIGEEYLYALLRKLSFGDAELKERNRLIRYFQTHVTEREQLQYALQRFGKMKELSLYDYLISTDEIKVKNPWMHYIYAIGFFIALGIIWVNPTIGILCTVFMLFNNIIRYYRTKATFDKYLNVFAYILRMLDEIDEIDDKGYEEIHSYIDVLKKDAAVFRSFRRGAFLTIGGRSVVGGVLDLFLDYIRMIFHIDIIKFNSMLSELRKHREELLDLYDKVGVLDSMIAVASFRDMVETYCEPDLIKSKRPMLDAVNLYHPLIKNPVKNSIHQNTCMLLTGSNASGKSTFLRTVAINAILSQTVYTSLSDSYKGSFYKIYSSMALTDSVVNNESYYMAEIKSLKRILDQMNEEIPVLCFVDEILRGTNTIERISASSEILHNIASHNVLCLAATHDIELTLILNGDYTNYHFQEEVKNNDVLFDYKLYTGKAKSKNAIKLLGMIGYDRTIIDAANKRANTFIQTGEWLAF